MTNPADFQDNRKPREHVVRKTLNTDGPRIADGPGRELLARNRDPKLTDPIPSYASGPKTHTVDETYRVDGDSAFGTRTSRKIVPHVRKGVPSVPEM